MQPLGVAALAAIPGVVAFDVRGRDCWMDTADASAAVTALMLHIGAERNRLEDIRIRRPSLEDVFVEVTGRRWSEAEGKAGR